MRFYWLILGCLGVWRITHLLQAEDGPFDLMVRLRRGVGDGFWGSLLDCFYCLSLWTALPFALLIGAEWKEWLLLWLAFSAGAIILQRITSDRHPDAPPALFFEDKEKDHVMLRQEKGTEFRNSAESTES